MADLKELKARYSELEEQYRQWKPVHQELAEYIPVGGFFEDDQPNRGEKKHGSVIDDTAERSLNVFAAGFQGGLTSPARPWFRLGLQNQDLAEFGPVKAWLYQVEKIMLAAFAKSNFYSTAHSTYLELGAFGTAGIGIEKDFSEYLRCSNYTIGSYYLTEGFSRRVDTVYRWQWMTVKQLADEFGEDRLTEATRRKIKDTPYDYVKVIHAVFPRDDYDPDKQDNRNMPFASVYFEDAATEEDGVLRESGYWEMPIIVARYGVHGDEVFGRSPGWQTLGHNKMLQEMAASQIQSVHLMLDPPLQIPSSFKHRISLLPGAKNYKSSNDAGVRAEPILNIKPDLQGALHSINDVRSQIRAGFFNDLFQFVQEPTATATEVAVRQEEKLLVLGPVIERQMNEFLNPVVDRVFGILLRGGALPPPPPEIQGADLKVEYISLLAQAQKLVGTQAIEGVAGFVGSLAQFDQTALDKLDIDQAIDEYSDRRGVPASIINSDDKVGAIRQRRMEMQKQQQMMAEAEQAANVAKTASQAKLDDPNALSALVGGG